MIRFLNSQPLLLPAFALALSILFVDLADYTSWFLAFFVILFIVLARVVSSLSFWLTILATLSGLLLHFHELYKMNRLSLSADREVAVLAIIEHEPRDARYFRKEVIVKVCQTTNESLTGARLLASIARDTPLKVGGKIWLRGQLHLPKKPMNIDVLDKAKLLHRKGITLELLVYQDQPIHKTANSHLIQAWAQSSRQWIRQQLTKGINDEDASKIILAMFLGEKPRNGSKIMNDFKFSGTIHVFAVSGLHVMMVGLLFTLFFRIIGIPLKIWILLVITIMFFYAIITGMNPPAMRAAIMGSAVLCALLLGRKPSLPNSLWLSAIIAMTWSTHCIFLPGFQLSYAVLISICLTGNWWANRWKWLTHLDPFFPRSLLSKKQKAIYQIRHKSAATLSVSSSAWVGSSLLIWLYFGLITPIAIIASLPIMLLVFGLLSVCCLSLTIGNLSDNIAEPLNKVNGFIANSTHAITRFFASADTLRYHYKPWSHGERVIIYSLPDGGAAHYIGIGGGVLLDAGSANHFYTDIWPSLDRKGARIDSIIASHSDVYHIQGIGEVMKKIPIKQLVIAKSNNRSTTHRSLINQANELNVNIVSPTRTSHILTNNSFIEILDTGTPSYPLADDRCCVFLLHWKDQKILFFNDAGGKSERRLRNHYPELSVDIIVIGKHSNDHSLSVDTIRAFGAKEIIATQAYYPTGETRSESWKAQLHSSGIKLYLLDQTGGIKLTQENGELDKEIILHYPLK